MTLAIRPAAEHDADSVEACVAAAFERYVERLGSLPRPMGLDFPAEIRAQHVWVAEDEDNITGVIVQYQTGSGFYIDTVAVSPARQGAGVGKALLTFAEEEARRRGYGSIYLSTNSKMTENLVFYPRIGYVEYEREQGAGFERVFYAKSVAAS